MAADPTRNLGRRGALSVLCALATLATSVASAHAQRLLSADEIDEIRGVDVIERLGDQVLLDATFTNAEGQTVELSRYLSGQRPAILALVYYDCPVVCTVVMDKLGESLNKMDYVAGKDFTLLVVSFDPTETTTHAFDRKMYYLSGYAHGQSPEIESGLQFMTGRSDQIRRLSSSVGFQHKLLDNGEYSHPVALTFLSPDGHVSRYMYGFDYPPKQIKLSLLEASDGKIATSLGDRILHYCYRYDPSAGVYSLQAMALMRLGGAITVVLLIVLIGGLLLGERARRRKALAAHTTDTTGSTGNTRAGLRTSA